jgi:hypothetical protein
MPIRDIERDILEIRQAKGEVLSSSEIDTLNSPPKRTATDPASLVMIPHDTAPLTQDTRDGRTDGSSQILFSMSQGRRF